MIIVFPGPESVCGDAGLWLPLSKSEPTELLAPGSGVRDSPAGAASNMPGGTGRG